jgi:hypothetical protein
VLRIELSDPSRLVELHDFYAKVHVVARINRKGLIVRLAGPPDANDERRLHAYLQTWLALAAASGRPVSAELKQEQTVEP